MNREQASYSGEIAKLKRVSVANEPTADNLSNHLVSVHSFFELIGSLINTWHAESKLSRS